MKGVLLTPLRSTNIMRHNGSFTLIYIDKVHIGIVRIQQYPIYIYKNCLNIARRSISLYTRVPWLRVAWGRGGRIKPSTAFCLASPVGISVSWVSLHSRATRYSLSIPTRTWIIDSNQCIVSLIFSAIFNIFIGKKNFWDMFFSEKTDLALRNSKQTPKNSARKIFCQ